MEINSNKSIQMIKCKCNLMPTGVSVVYMGYEDNHILDTYDRIHERDGKYWWLYASQCRICKRYLLIAQEERHNDLWCILELNDQQVSDISEKNIWPTDFDKYETLLEIGYNFGRTCTHADPLEGMVHSIVHDLVLENPSIEISRLCLLLDVDMDMMQKIYSDVTDKNITWYM